MQEASCNLSINAEGPTSSAENALVVPNPKPKLFIHTPCCVERENNRSIKLLFTYSAHSTCTFLLKITSRHERPGRSPDTLPTTLLDSYVLEILLVSASGTRGLLRRTPYDNFLVAKSPARMNVDARLPRCVFKNIVPLARS